MLVDEITAMLRAGKIANCRREAGWIVAECPDAASALDAARRRAAGEPLQYVLGTAPFRDLMLDVDSRVLIPRPETEGMVDWILPRVPSGGTVLDLGTGSGAIALAVAQERPDVRVTAVDRSREALDAARHNAAKCGLADRVEFLRSDLFSSLTNRRFDLIAANLPYVTEAEYLQLAPEVRDYEPRSALVAPDCGLALILRAVEGLSAHLGDSGAAIFELSPPQAPRAAAALTAAGFRAGIVRDLCGRDRFATGER
ncbi:MAG: peptide chain release factor N(5)-glutamine methyltransferase [Lentisphaeria bacterium]|nr:peptide chain release factor N(5)-glutamine methyltransferase [Lentisphaeria bacterium]